MSYAERHSVTVTTDADGNATEYTPVLTGRIQSITYTKTDYADTADFTITTETTGHNLWVDTNITATETVVPREAVHSTAGAAVTFDGSRAIVEPVCVAQERVKIVVAQGGATKTGTFIVVVG